MGATKTFDAINRTWERLDRSPRDGGSVELIVRRPVEEKREELQVASFSAANGLDGDDWFNRARRSAPDTVPDKNTQITLMNSRVIQLLCDDKARWAESGDQLFVDLDISKDNLPAGAQLQIGGVVMEISHKPHTGCAKFASRFGAPARKWVMTDEGKALRLRGVYARVMQDGTIKVGDQIRKIQLRN